MAIKKCDDTTPDAPVTEEEEVVVQPTTTETTDETTQGAPSTIAYLTYLGKTQKIVEYPLYNESQPGVHIPILTGFGNNNISQTRPGNNEANTHDQLRLEARKFFAYSPIDDENGRMVYVNSNLGEASDNDPTTEFNRAYGKSPITIQVLGTPTIGPPTTTAWDTYGAEIYSQDMRVRSNLFVGNVNDQWPPVPSALDTLFNVFLNGGPPPYANHPLSRESPLIRFNHFYSDHFTDITIPYSKTELERYVNNINNPSYAGVDSDYNFFISGYEDEIADSAANTYSEKELPNLYVLNDKSETPSAATTLIKELGIGMEYVRNRKTKSSEGQAASVTSALRHLKYIGITKEFIPTLQRGSDFDDVHPMNNTLELKTDITGDFLGAVEETGMTDDILKFVMNEVYRIAETGNPQTAYADWEDFAIFREKIVTSDFETEGTSATNPDRIAKYTINSEIMPQEQLRTMDFGKWLSNYLDEESQHPYEVLTNFPDNTMFLGQTQQTEGQTDECSTFLKTLQSLILVAKIKQIATSRFRTFEQMLEGKEAHNEAIAYEIVKKNGTGILQRFFVPNVTELDIIKYIDTQVKYNKEYSYEIFVHRLIVGTQYRYVKTGTWQPGDAATTYGNTRLVEFGVEYGPSLKIVRIPIFESRAVKILDAAPVWPNVDIIPYKGVVDEILINLSSNVGNYELQPVLINQSDATFADNYRQARDLLPTDPITFKSDDPTKTFEIYKMDTPPTSRQDFAGNLLVSLTSDVATAASYVDKISPNQKYYYMFRSVDVHQNRSNPTEVYQVEMIEFDGMSFFYTSIYEFEDPLKKNNNIAPSKEFRRYLKISPNLIQSLINYKQTFPDRTTADGVTFGEGESNTAYNTPTVVLGQTEESVWSSDTNPQRFKIRITSKNSGKKIDLNLTCKVEYTSLADPNQTNNGNT
jgi:hypothetical protein